MPAVHGAAESDTTYRLNNNSLAWGIFVHLPGMESGPVTVKALGLNHWTTKEFPAVESYREAKKLESE